MRFGLKGVKVKMVGSVKRKRKSRNNEAAIDKRWMILALFAAVVALTGGASRYDAIQIIPLRALSALFLIGSLIFVAKANIAAERILCVFFVSFALIVALQLVPLPPSIWQSLPQRDEVVQFGTPLGLQEAWRPLTLAPMRTWNVVGSLVVPGAALLLAVAFQTSYMTLLRIVAALGVVNALFGLIQVATGTFSILYLYEVTNKGSPVGILANENHSAVFAACSMLVVTFLGLKLRHRPSPSWERLVYPIAFFLILFVSLVGGSRAGFLAAIGAILASMTMLVLSSGRRGKRPAGDVVRRWLDERPRLILAIPAIIVTLTAVAFLSLDRAPAFRDFIARDNFEDLRWSLWPVIVEMLENHWVLGTGFGSFEQVFHVYEPSALLFPSYVNQAHIDWAQFIIEGGALAGILLIGLLAWLVKRVAIMASQQALRVDAVFWMSLLVLIAMASAIDYPLRTPLFQVVTVWLLVALSRDARDVKTK